MERTVSEQIDLQELIAAHRNLAARHEALFQMSKAMFAILPASVLLKMQTGDLVRQVVQAEQRNEPFDDQYRSVVMQAIDELAEAAALEGPVN
jgi:hypothetical protein